MTSEDKVRMKIAVILVLVEEYKLAQVKATEFVNNSVFAELVEDDPFFVGHYNAEYWAKEVAKEYEFV